MNGTKLTHRRGVTLLELLVASIGAFAVLGGLMGLYMTSLLLYRTAVRNDLRLAATGQLEALLNNVAATCPMERMRIFNAPAGPLADGYPQWRALAYDRLSAHTFLQNSPAGVPPFALWNPFTPGMPPARPQWYPRVQESVSNVETGLIYWWRDPATYNAAQNRFMESRIYHLRATVQRGNQANGVPDQLRHPMMFNTGQSSFFTMTDAAVEALIGNVRTRRVSQIMAEDVLELLIELDPPWPHTASDELRANRILRWRYDGYRGP